jgi:hypothetical protein
VREFLAPTETKEDRHGYEPDGSQATESGPTRKVD